MGGKNLITGWQKLTCWICGKTCGSIWTKVDFQPAYGLPKHIFDGDHVEEHKVQRDLLDNLSRWAIAYNYATMHHAEWFKRTYPIGHDMGEGIPVE